MTTGIAVVLVLVGQFLFYGVPHDQPQSPRLRERDLVGISDSVIGGVKPTPARGVAGHMKRK